VRCAGEVAGLRQAGLGEVAREAEVGEQRRAVGAQQDVRRLDVALLVQVGECFGDRQHAAQCGPLGGVGPQERARFGAAEFLPQRHREPFAGWRGHVARGRQQAAARQQRRQRAAVD
jgi:hypothetical protein